MHARIMLFLREIFVKLLVLKGLASEPPPIDRQGQDPTIRLGHSRYHHSQPNLRILTRSTDSAAARHLAGGGLVHPRIPHSQAWYAVSPAKARSARPLYPLFTGYLRKESPERQLEASPSEPFGTWPSSSRWWRSWDAVLEAGVRAFTVFGRSPLHWDLAVHAKPHHLSLYPVSRAGGSCFAILNSFHEFALARASTAVVFNLIVIVASFGICYRPILRLFSPSYQTPAVVLAGGFCSRPPSSF